MDLVPGGTEEVQGELEAGSSSGSGRTRAVAEEVVKNMEMEDHLVRVLIRNSGGKKPGKKVIFVKREIQCTRKLALHRARINPREGR
jgi:hypothetical protein